MWSCLMAFGLAEAASRRAVSLEELGAWVQEPLALRYSPPPLPTILSLESLVISRFRVYCWCSFVLDKMHMISDLLKLGLRILMASGRLELTVGTLHQRLALVLLLLKLLRLLVSPLLLLLQSMPLMLQAP